MSLATILLLVQIIAGLTGSTASLIAIIKAIETDGGIEAVGAKLLGTARGLATPGALNALKVAHPDVHASAVVLLSADAGAV